MHFKVEVPLFIALMVSWVSCQDCGNSKLTANYGEFMSPNYPNKYDHNADCTWTIIAPRDHFIEVQFEKFDVRNPFWECTHDYITVTYDEDSSEKFCNDHKAPDVIKSRTNTLTFHLQSDHFFSNGVGFKAKYYIVDKSDNKLAGEDDDNDGWDDESTGQKTETAISVPGKTDQSNNAISKGDDSKPPVVKPSKKPKNHKGKKGRKGKKGKKQRKSKEERRRERKLRKKRERDLKRALRKKNRKNRKNKKAKRASTSA